MPSKITLSTASEADRQSIYSIRHAIYAKELHQHPTNLSGQLRDKLDEVNQYIVAKVADELVGFVSITPPAAPTYSVDKYVGRSAIPYPFDDYLYEVRLLTVVDNYRSSHAALGLMVAAFRWVQAHGGRAIVAIGRTNLMPMYQKAGLRSLGIQVPSGAVTYELCTALVNDLQASVEQKKAVYEALQAKLNWQLPFSFFAPSACYHGGQFFNAIGEDLQTLHKAAHIINADVLDAWFSPSPKVLRVLQDHLAWLLQTSPPTHADGLTRTIAQVRGVPVSCVLAGAGSSDLIFLALSQLLTERSTVLLLDPCYGEYAHVLEKVIRCQVNRFRLRREEGFVINTARLLHEINQGYDLVVLVNPNSPTGVHLPKHELQGMLVQVPASTQVWIDETYIDYVSSVESIETFVVQRENVIVCKSMSKAYALSGARVGYLCSSPHLLESLRSLTPPWAVSLPAQAAAIAALTEPAYYQEKYDQTHVLREKLRQQLRVIGLVDSIPGVANFLLTYLPDQVTDVPTFLASCQQEGLFLRDVSNMGESLGKNAIRIAVKDEPTIDRMIGIIDKALATALTGVNRFRQLANQ